MMLSIKQTKNASYYTNEFGEKENYYDKESKGFWIGSAKTYLGLGNELKIDEYNKLFKGQSPDGKALTFQTGKNRNYDLTASCNKDISILKAAYPEIANRLDQITLNATKEMLSEAQKFVAVRETKNGVTTRNYETNSVFALFHHSTSRELDPQEHYHCIGMSVSFNEKGEAYASDFSDVYKNKKYLGSVFQKAIARDLLREFGLKSTSNEKGLFRILGIKKEERDYFSKRKEQIEKLAGPNASYKEKDEASLKSRKTKTDYDLEKLKQGWNKELKEKFGFTAERFQQMQKLQDKPRDIVSTKSPETKANRSVSLLKNISKLAGVKPRATKSSLKQMTASLGAGATREALQSSINNLQTSLGQLQGQLAGMKQDDPSRLQVFSSLINMGFQLQALNQKLAEFETKEFQKKLDEQKVEEKEKEKQPSNNKQQQNSKAPSRSLPSAGASK
jgi:conjugative relaxase-like TrwC/TraI family protein